MAEVLRLDYQNKIDIPGKPLGRLVEHDPRSRDFAFQASVADPSQLASVRHQRHISVLDQGHVGSCTGNAMDGALGSGKIYDALVALKKLPSDMSETFALELYHLATTFDGFGDPYPPNDRGSSGLAVAKAAQSLGLISEYHHAFTDLDALAALAEQPVILGTDWYQGFDHPDPTTGMIAISGLVRGGHEVELDEIDVANKLVWLINSWGLSWAKQGRACMTWQTFSTLLASSGDVTIVTPDVAPPLPPPAPVPTPPPAPIPTPPPAPTPTPPSPDQPAGCFPGSKTMKRVFRI